VKHTVTFEFQTGDLVTIHGAIPGIVVGAYVRAGVDIRYEVEYFDDRLQVQQAWMNASWLKPRQK